jgi:hypothetical protein
VKQACESSPWEIERRSLGVDIKVAQELMRHSSCRKTPDIYTRAVSQQKREANIKVVEMMPPLEVQKLQHPSASAQEPAENRSAAKSLSMDGLLVDLIGIEPMTSSMPWRINNLRHRRQRSYEPV